jgi:hypothetical protein
MYRERGGGCRRLAELQRREKWDEGKTGKNKLKENQPKQNKEM